MTFRLPIIERRTMTIFSRKGTACPQCAEFKTRVRMETLHTLAVHLVPY